MYKVLKSIYTLESTNRFIYEQILVCIHIKYVISSSLVVSLTKCINSLSSS